MKHVGKMKNNSARVAVVYRTVPSEANNALVVGTTGLPDAYHDALMGLIESEQCQQANELADLLAVRRFPDGEVMLNWLHTRGHLKKVPTNMVLMTPNKQTTIQLDELNKMIAEQMGVTVEDLAVTDGSQKAVKKPAPEKEAVITDDVIISEDTTRIPTPAVAVEAVTETEEISDPVLVAKSYRSKADKLSKDAANFRRMADAIDPPVKKPKAAKTVA